MVCLKAHTFYIASCAFHWGLNGTSVEGTFKAGNFWHIFCLLTTHLFQHIRYPQPNFMPIRFKNNSSLLKIRLLVFFIAVDVRPQRQSGELITIHLKAKIGYLTESLWAG